VAPESAPRIKTAAYSAVAAPDRCTRHAFWCGGGFRRHRSLALRVGTGVFPLEELPGALLGVKPGNLPQRGAQIDIAGSS
jgi:hypothetical protein